MVQVTKIFRPLILTLAVSSVLSGCGESSSSTAGGGYGDTNTPTVPATPDTKFNQTELLANLTDNVITPTYQEFKTLVIAQQQAVAEYCAAETSYHTGEPRDEVNAALIAAQTSWQAAMNTWQQIEVMQLGPLTDNSATLRNNIYSWPVVSSCAVDQDVLYFANGDINGTPYDINRRTATRRGLDSLEYLLFNTALSHSCANPPAVLTPWPQMTSEQHRVARCNFATEVSQDLINNSDILLTKWLGDSGYALTLKQAGSPDNAFATAHDGVNAVSDALFYLDSMTKDAKLGTPLGIFNNDCGGICPASVESPYSDNSLNNLINNLKGFEKLLSGAGSNTNNNLGFDDFLIEQQDNTTSEQLSHKTQLAIAELEALDGSLALTLIQDPTKVEAAHATVKALTDQLKTDFITNLALELPETSAGDND